MGHSRVGMLVVSGAAVGLIVGTGGCHFSFHTSSAREVDKHDVETEIVSKMTESIDNKPLSVGCPSGLPAKVGAKIKCKMKIDVPPNDVNVIATVTAIDGKTVKYDLMKTVEQDRVAQLINDKLFELKGRRPDSLTCPEDLKGYPGAELRCQLVDGRKTYGVNVTVNQSPGPQVNFDFKVDDRPQ